MNIRCWYAGILFGFSVLVLPVSAQNVGTGRDFSGNELQNRDLRGGNPDGANLCEVNPTAAGAKVLDPNKPAAAPPEEAVKALLEKFWARERVKNTFNYQTLKYGKPRKGEFRTDGVPANSDTMVFPVMVVCEHVVGYQDGTSKSEIKAQQFVFFQSEFGEWTFRFKGNS